MLMWSGISGKPLPDRSSPRRGPSRRRVLALGAAVGLSIGLTGCTQPPAAAPIPLEPDELSVNRAVAAARALRTAALALAETRTELAGLLRRVATVHEEHLAALGSPVGPSASASPTASEASDGATPSAEPAPAPTAAQLIKAEVAAARTALRDGLAAAPAFAVLLGRIAAARIVNADLISAADGRKLPGVLRPADAADPGSAGTATPPVAASTAAGPSPTSPAGAGDASPTGPSAGDPLASTPGAAEPDPLASGPVDPDDLIDPGTAGQLALDRLLAGEHAAVFAYPLIVARSSGRRRALASALWQAHRTERDELSAELLSAGIRPAVAEPAYDVGALPSSPAKAAALAARVELGLAALATDLLAAASGAGATSTALGVIGATTLPGAAGTPGPTADQITEDNAADRRLGADQLILAARRAAGWTGKPIAFPGQIARASSGTATPTASLTASAGPT